jgi:hypothetical protein
MMVEEIILCKKLLYVLIWNALFVHHNIKKWYAALTLMISCIVFLDMFLYSRNNIYNYSMVGCCKTTTFLYVVTPNWALLLAIETSQGWLVSKKGRMMRSCTYLLHWVSTFKCSHDLHLSRWWKDKVVVPFWRWLWVEDDSNVRRGGWWRHLLHGYNHILMEQF